MSDIPEEVRTLAAERQEARAAKDFARADALRDAIAELGFKVVDGPEGPMFEPLVAPGSRGRRLRRATWPRPRGAGDDDASVHWVGRAGRGHRPRLPVSARARRDPSTSWPT
jgi:hypothetical protein